MSHEERVHSLASALPREEATMNHREAGDWKRGHMLGAHSLCHRRPWKQDIVEEQLIEPRVMRQSDAREWIQIALLQPVDVRTKYVKVPVVKFVDKYVPKIMYHENTIEVPRIVHKTVQKFVEKPYIKYVDKYEEVPEIRYKYTYVPKETIQERSVYKPRFTVVEKVKYKEKRQVKFVDRYVEIPEREVALQCEAGIFPENNQLVDHVVQGEEAAESSTSREVRLLPSEDNDTSGEEERKSDQDVTSSDLSSEYSFGGRCLRTCCSDSRGMARSGTPLWSVQSCVCSECRYTS